MSNLFDIEGQNIIVHHKSFFHRLKYVMLLGGLIILIGVGIFCIVEGEPSSSNYTEQDANQTSYWWEEEVEYQGFDEYEYQG